MVVSERVSEETYRRLALEQPDRIWELYDGRLRDKPGMSVEHDDLLFELAHALRLQLDRRHYRVRVNAPRLCRPPGNSYLPDVAVVPFAIEQPLRATPGTLNAFDEPLPLIVEVWSPSTGTYDVEEKLAAYQALGDEEIWRLHPYERTLTTWRRRPDGGYDKTLDRGGIVPVGSLPHVAIDLDGLFAD